MSTNPFEDDDADYLVLTNDEAQHSLWPAALLVPNGWSVVYGPGTRAEALAYVDAEWTDLRPDPSRGSKSSAHIATQSPVAPA